MVQKTLTFTPKGDLLIQFGDTSVEEYLVTLRTLHKMLNFMIKRDYPVSSISSVRDSLKQAELFAPYQCKNIINLMYNSDLY